MTALLPIASGESELRALLTFRKHETQLVFDAYYAMRAEAGQEAADAVLQEFIGPVRERLVYEPLGDVETPQPPVEDYRDWDC